MPLLLCLADHDLEASSKFAARVAARAPAAQIRHYAAGHFDVYLGSTFDHVSDDEAAFLASSLGVAVPSGARRAAGSA